MITFTSIALIDSLVIVIVCDHDLGFCAEVVSTTLPLLTDTTIIMSGSNSTSPILRGAAFSSATSGCTLMLPPPPSAITLQLLAVSILILVFPDHYLIKYWWKLLQCIIVCCWKLFWYIWLQCPCQIFYHPNYFICLPDCRTVMYLWLKYTLSDTVSALDSLF